MENINLNENNKKTSFTLTKKHYIMFGLFFSLFFTLILIMPIAGDDYWWHTKVGEWIVKNKEIPTTGIFSWYAKENNLDWFAHEWLCEVFLYGLSILFGDNGGVVYLFITIILIGSLLYIFNYKDYLKNLTFSSFWIFIGFFAIASISTARPHMLTISMLALLIYICEKIKKDENYKLYFLYSIISIIWANYHGGSSNLTYIIPIIYFITNSFNFKYERIQSIKVKKSYRYLILAIINTLALFLNPRTYELLFYPYSYTADYDKYIAEWMSPSIANGGFAIFLIILICLILFTTKIEIQFSDLALIGCFMLLTLQSIRFNAWLYIVATMLIFKYIREIKDKSIYKYLCYEFCILGIAFLTYSIYSFHNGTTYIEKYISEEVIDILKTENYENLMNYYDYGSYLIYEDIEVFIDGRADMYVDSNFIKSAEATRYTYDYTPEEFIKEFKFDMFILPKENYLSFYLEQNEDKYKKIYTDDILSIFKEISNN